MKFIPHEEKIAELLTAIVARTGYPIQAEWRNKTPRGHYEEGVRIISPNGDPLTSHMNEYAMVQTLIKVVRIIGAVPEGGFSWE